MHLRTAAVGRHLAILAALLAVTFAAYAPALSAGFVWDDDDWLTENPDITDPDGLARIWGGPTRIQYYPVLFTVFRVQHALWGFEPAGYHAVNVVLHAVNAFLIGLILRRLDVGGAWWVAALFALHPVHVESVAWVTELKNVLSGALYLGAFLAFLRFDRSRAPAPYLVALGMFAAAMLTKTATATFPVALLIALLHRRRKLSTGDLAGVAPFFAVALTLAWVTVRLEEGLIDAVRAEFELTAIQRSAVAGRALLFYPWKLLFPYPLIFNYPRWSLGGGPVALLWPLLPLAGCGIALVVGWLRGIRGAALAAAFYGVTIAPALGFFNVYAFRYSFVADHFQYLASIGVSILIVQAFVVAGRRLDARAPSVAGAILLVACGVLTFVQARAYRDVPTLWLDTVSKNPDSWIAHHNLGAHHLEQGDPAAALRYFDEAIRCKPSAGESHSGRGTALLRLERRDEALAALDRAVALAPGYPQARLNRGLERVRSGRYADALEDLDRFLAANPDVLPALGARAKALMELGRFEAAFRDLDAALEGGAGVQGHIDRATLSLRAGRFEQAATDIREASRLAPDDPRPHLLAGMLAGHRENPVGACAAWRLACERGACHLFELHCSTR